MTYLRAALYVAGIAALTCLSLLFLETRRTVARIATLPIIVDSAITRESGNVQRAVFAELFNLRHAVAVEIRQAKIAAVGESKAWRGMVDTRLVSAEGMADKHLTALDAPLVATLVSADATIREARDTLENTSRITGDVAEASDVLLDCESNPQCIQNRTIGTMQSVERASQAVAIAAPKLSASAVTATSNIAGITGDVHKVSQRLSQPPKWWERVLSIVGSVGAGVARVWQ